jgi:hypothetical protein
VETPVETPVSTTVVPVTVTLGTVGATPNIAPIITASQTSEAQGGDILSKAVPWPASPSITIILPSVQCKSERYFTVPKVNDGYDIPQNASWLMYSCPGDVKSVSAAYDAKLVTLGWQRVVQGVSKDESYIYTRYKNNDSLMGVYFLKSGDASEMALWLVPAESPDAGSNPTVAPKGGTP